MHGLFREMVESTEIERRYIFSRPLPWRLRMRKQVALPVHNSDKIRMNLPVKGQITQLRDTRIAMWPARSLKIFRVDREGNGQASQGGFTLR